MFLTPTFPTYKSATEFLYTALSQSKKLIQTVASSSTDVTNRVKNIADALFGNMSFISKDLNTMTNICKKLNSYILGSLEYLFNAPGKFNSLAATSNSFQLVLEPFQILGDLNYFINEKSNQDSKFKISAQALSLVVNAASMILLLNKTPLFNNFTLKSRIFSVIGKTSPLFLISRGVDLIHLCKLADASNEIKKAKDLKFIRAKKLDQVNCVSELLLSAALIAGTTNIVALGVLSTSCLVSSLGSFLYNKNN